MHKHYPVVIYKDPDSDYCVTVPDLPGCITAGNTFEDAQNQAVEAIQCYVEGMLLDGEPVPEAKTIAFYQDNPDYADGVTMQHEKQICISSIFDHNSTRVWRYTYR